MTGIATGAGTASEALGDRRILVTGSTGFLGERVVDQLSRLTSVVATGRRADRLAEVSARHGATPLPLDLADESCIDRLVATHPDLIVHCAALASPWGRPDAFHRSNVSATQHVLAAAASTAVPVVHISTPAVYMGGPPTLDISEDQALPERSPNDYVATKRAAEDLVRTHTTEGRGPTVILRPQALIGAGDTTIAPRLLRVARWGVLPLIDGGHSVLDLTHVANAAQAVVLAAARLATAEFAGNDVPVFNVTNGDPRPVRDLLALFASVQTEADPAGRRPRLVSVPSGPLEMAACGLEAVARTTGYWEPPLTRYSVALLSQSRTLNIDRARTLLGYDPAPHALDDAFREFVRSRTVAA